MRSGFKLYKNIAQDNQMKSYFYLLTVLVVMVMLFSFSGNLTAQSSFTLPKQVKLDSGLIEGIPGRNPSIMVFKGIPYAAAPVGELRWKPPQAPATWSEVKTCNEFGPSAIQSAQAPFSCWSAEFIIDTAKADKTYSEDCLTLNVWTDASSADSKRPVLVFIHGGGFTSGGSSCEVYDGEGLAKKGIVFVSINYRVGTLGFLAHPDLSAESESHASGNYALLDQIAALKWVKNNIAAFGGNPDNVTIQGQSAGSGSVEALIMSPLAKGLFHKAVAQSFNYINRPLTKLADAEQTGKRAMGDRTLAQMRALSVQDLARISVSSGPIIDGYVITGSMLDTLKAGKQNDVQLISGMVVGDSSLFGFFRSSGRGRGGASAAFTLAQYQTDVKTTCGDLADKFLAAYPASGDAEAQTQRDAITRDSMNVLQYFLAKAMSIHGKSETYVYYLTHVMPDATGGKQFGAFHTSDVPYSFNYFSPLRKQYWTDADYKLGETMSSYWANFAKTGNPNGQGLPSWPVCKGENAQIMELGDALAVMSLPKEKVSLWQEYYKFDF
jgi:para-nitrobenzyl esterase